MNLLTITRRLLMNLLTITRRILMNLLTITRRILMHLLTITRLLMHLLTILLLPSQGLLLVIPSLITRGHLMKSMILLRQTR